MNRLIGSLLLLSLCFIACQKEVSFETGSGPSAGSLQSDVSGDCLPKTVSGIYEVNKALKPDSNYIQVEVDVLQTGSYVISTNTVNGMSFTASGFFTTTGSNTVKLKGDGTPLTDGISNFVVTYDSTVCDIAVTVLPAGGAVPAVFTLDGSPDACMNAQVSGSYVAGTLLTIANSVIINVTVSTAGTYDITTVQSNGMIFKGQGTLGSGPQTITLTASGTTAIVADTTNIPVTFGPASNKCSFEVIVTGPAIYTISCATATVNGNYRAGTVLNASTNTITLPVTVTSIGAYNISGTVNNMTFSASGNFTSTASGQTITLIGSNIPTDPGTFNLQLTVGVSTCTIPITVTAAAPIDYYPRTTNSNWSYEYNDVTTDTVLMKVIAPTITAFGNPFNIFMGTDDVSTGFDTAGYYRRNGGDYYEFIDMGTYLDFDDPQWVQYIFLKDNVNQGVSWQSPGYTGNVSGSPFTFRLNYKIGQKDVTVNVEGTNYPNTIVVEERIDFFTAGTWQDITSAIGHYKAYYARGVGMIKYEYYDPTGVLDSWKKLKRYQVF